MSDARALAELQRDFQRHVMHGQERIIEAVGGSPSVPASVRLGIYSEAYRLRLTDALASTLPRLQQLMGKEPFSATALEYIDLCPSSYPSIRWFGDQLPRLLRRSFPEQPWLAELATWEWTIAAAFDGPDAEPATVATLAAVAPEQWPTLQFQFHPTVQCLQLQSNAPQLFKALTEETLPPPPVALEQPQAWLIWREGLKTQYRSLEADEHAALEVMRAGGTFEALCDTLCAWHEAEAVPAQAASMLKRWVVDQMIVGVS
ncbi:putative DNA-binding domain-containing protein [Steroidobacter sp. S1-65]|uniref:DNA-binding domain-containing protein n=1 Tax=Steroidobacter gossypii TaxID=2805490 RepID=A0ABS1WRN9_9GAMM|nr:DNA-binding domain-containing protein [Steroidobacter gossypii]MBM0103634.1 putative DNA-binding domain-containing protein [Steroidobacter gossypii]